MVLGTRLTQTDRLTGWTSYGAFNLLTEFDSDKKSLHASAELLRAPAKLMIRESIWN